MSMDAYLAVVSKREVREYSDQPIPDDVLRRILQAGRATGSSRNRQPWRFYVIRDRAALERVSECVYAPDNIKGSQLSIAIVMTRKQSFDAGRAAQNIGLAAWALGVGTCPNGIRDMDRLREVLDLEEDWDVPTILSVGYPAEPIRPASDDPDDILSRIDRKPLEELVHWVD